MPRSRTHRCLTGRPHRGRLILLGLVALLAAGWLVSHLAAVANQHRQQAALQPFYATPPGFEPAAPGQVLRSAPMNIAVPAGGQAVRVLYRSERDDGTPTVSSGMIFYPAQSAAGRGRPVVAWAHGTIGFGDSCAPSRTADPTADLTWLGQMLSRGWVVAATDYAGLGTDGTIRYLVGGDEARDVLNSVRAARQLDPEAGDRFALFGHSQGGHAALWAAAGAPIYAPELTLVGTAAGAPAAELPQLFTEQYRGAASWVIGPDVTVSWPSAYPDLKLNGVVTNRGLRTAAKIAGQCAQQSGEGALIKGTLKERYFAVNPMSVPSWQQAAAAQTPPPPSPIQPLLIAQSLSDQVVLPDTTARFVQRACAAGSNVATLWLDGVTHQQTAIAAGPSVVDWLGDRFAGQPNGSSCAQPLPITPSG